MLEPGQESDLDIQIHSRVDLELERKRNSMFPAGIEPATLSV